MKNLELFNSVFGLESIVNKFQQESAKIALDRNNSLEQLFTFWACLFPQSPIFFSLQLN